MSNYYLLASLLSWIFPSQKDAQNFKHMCKLIDHRKTIDRVHRRYKTILEKLKLKYKKEKIKVVFLNDTAAKWQYQSLYEELSLNNNFEVQVLVTVMDYQKNSKIKKIIDYKEQARKCYQFFKNNKMNVDYAYDFEKDEPIDLKIFSPDIVFYEQPWGLFKIHNIEETSKYALSCYSSYGSAITLGKQEYSPIYYMLLYKYFVDNDATKKLLLEHSAKSENIVVSGHPKLDNYLRPLRQENIYWKTKNKKKIIIAPHFSFYSKASLHSGTFDKNYKFLLNYAKEHTEYEFIFKPHPKLKEDIVCQNLMTLEECQQYYKEWGNLPNTQLVEGGNYIDMFRTSDLLITDCNSFLFEYLPTEKPVINIINKDFVGHNSFGKMLISGYYSVVNNDEIKQIIHQLLEEKYDPLKGTRKKILDSGIHPKDGYSKLVINTLINCITNAKCEQQNEEDI